MGIDVYMSCVDAVSLYVILRPVLTNGAITMLSELCKGLLRAYNTYGNTD